MAQINVSEDDFMRVANAAYYALERGDPASAYALDKLARKINLALSTETAQPYAKLAGHRTRRTWRDMPSTLEPMK